MIFELAEDFADMLAALPGAPEQTVLGLFEVEQPAVRRFAQGQAARRRNVFGAGAVEATVSGLGGQAHLSMLAAILIVSLVLAPIATAAALRVAEDAGAFTGTANPARLAWLRGGRVVRKPRLGDVDIEAHDRCPEGEPPEVRAEAARQPALQALRQIGRASCRERV